MRLVTVRGCRWSDGCLYLKTCELHDPASLLSTYGVDFNLWGRRGKNYVAMSGPAVIVYSSMRLGHSSHWRQLRRWHWSPCIFGLRAG